MENDPPGVETLPLTAAQAEARALRVRDGFAQQRKEREEREEREQQSRAALAQRAIVVAKATACPVSQAAPLATMTAGLTANAEPSKQQAAAALATAMAKHGSGFRVRVMSQPEWDAVAAVRMRADKCDKSTALEREFFVMPCINVRNSSKG